MSQEHSWGVITIEGGLSVIARTVKANKHDLSVVYKGGGFES